LVRTRRGARITRRRAARCGTRRRGPMRPSRDCRETRAAVDCSNPLVWLLDRRLAGSRRSEAGGRRTLVRPPSRRRQRCPPVRSQGPPCTHPAGSDGSPRRPPGSSNRSTTREWCRRCACRPARRPYEAAPRTVSSLAQMSDHSISAVADRPQSYQACLRRGAIAPRGRCSAPMRDSRTRRRPPIEHGKTATGRVASGAPPCARRSSGASARRTRARRDGADRSDRHERCVGIPVERSALAMAPSHTRRGRVSRVVEHDDVKVGMQPPERRYDEPAQAPDPMTTRCRRDASSAGPRAARSRRLREDAPLVGDAVRGDEHVLVYRKPSLQPPPAFSLEATDRAGAQRPTAIGVLAEMRIA